MARKYRICLSCVMDTTDSAIKFDSRGICDHCRNFYSNILPNWRTDSRGREALLRIARRIRREGQRGAFDCILGISGGIDSSYLTFVAKEMLGLRPLVFHVDAGWNSQEAVNNIEKIVEGLGLELFTEVVDWEEMKDLQLSFFKAGVAHLDTPQDHAFFTAMYNFASKYGVKYILTGANYSTECVVNPTEWHYHAGDLRQLLDIHARFGTRRLIRFPLANILKYKVYDRFIRGVRVVTPLNYVPYVKSEAMELLRTRFGWQPYSQKHFESRFTRFYEGYWLPVKFGFDKRRVQYSSLILTGQMTRSEALERLKTPPYDESTIPHDFEYVATKLGITTQELDGYLRSPNRSYRDYRSQIRTYLLGTRIMRALGLERRTIR